MSSSHTSQIILSNVCDFESQRHRCTNTELSARLAATGYIPTQRRFTPQQVKLLYHYLGEPFYLSEEIPQKSLFYILHFTFYKNKRF